MLDANSQTWIDQHKVDPGITEEQRQAPILADIARWEQELADGVAARDAAEVVLGVRRGPGLVADHSRGREAHRQVAKAQEKIGKALSNLDLLERRLARPLTAVTA